MEYWKNLGLADIKYLCEIDLVWKTEQWVSIPDYEGIYIISDLGRVKSFSKLSWNGHGFYTKKECILKQCISTSGYLCVNLWKNTMQKPKSIHVLSGISFLGHIPNGFKKVIDHKNNIKTDNRKVNLQITTNRFNSMKDKTPKSGHSCIYLNSNAWLVRMRVNGVKKSIGRFKDINEAIKQRDLFIASENNKQTIQ